MTTDNGQLVAGDLQRSTHWPTVRLAHLKLEPQCAACGGTVDLQVHHVVPFHYCIQIANRPDLELDHKNLITLCQDPKTDHHLIVGHLNDFHSYNPDVRKDSKRKKGWISTMLDSLLRVLRIKPKPKPIAKMSDQDKQKFIAMVTKLYPVVVKT